MGRTSIAKQQFDRYSAEYRELLGTMPDLVTCDWHGNDPHGEIAACRNPRPAVIRIDAEVGPRPEVVLAAFAKAGYVPGYVLTPAEAATHLETHPEIATHAALLAVREIQARYLDLRPQYERVQRERREAMKLAHDSGASYQDLADILGVNRQTVAKMLRKP